MASTGFRYWSDVPMELIENIGLRLNTETDVSQFRAICKSWRSSIPPLKNHGQALFPIRVRITKSITSETLRVRESLVYHLAPPPSHGRGDRGWVVKVEKGNKHRNHLMMLHPLSATPFHMQQMPKPLGFQKVLNSLDFHAFELAKAYRLYSDDVKSGSESPMLGYRVAISSLTAVLMIVAMGELYHCKLNDFDDDHIVKCNPVGWLPADYDDVILYKEKFYVVGEETVVLDSSLILITVISCPKFPNPISYRDHRKYLVESLGELLLVYKYPCAPISCTPLTNVIEVTFKVFKLSKTVDDEEQWVEMESLDDRILFVGIDSRFSVSAKDFPGCNGNCIYFYDPRLTQFCRYYSTSGVFSDIGVFNFGDGNLCPLTYYRDCRNIFCPSLAY